MILLGKVRQTQGNVAVSRKRGLTRYYQKAERIICSCKEVCGEVELKRAVLLVETAVVCNTCAYMLMGNCVHA